MENLVVAFICDRCALPGFIPVPADTVAGTKLLAPCRHCGHRQQFGFVPPIPTQQDR